MRQPLVLALLFACSSTPATSPPNDAGAEVPADPPTIGGDRPVSVLRVPESYDPKKPAPLVMVLHGYGAGGLIQNIYFQLGSIADKEGFFLVAPDGTVDKSGKRFWNAVDTCCDFDDTKVDDVKYLSGLVSEVRGHYAIDPKRVYLVGHSNGGAMSMRLGCDKADVFAAIVDLAGPFYSDPSVCKPSQPVSLLHLHGTLDETVPYAGGPLGVGGRKTPPAKVIAETFADRAGCAKDPVTVPAVDLERSIAGAETELARWSGCRSGAEVQLATIVGGSHIPKDFTAELPRFIWSFLAAHPKP